LVKIIPEPRATRSATRNAMFKVIRANTEIAVGQQLAAAQRMAIKFLPTLP